MRSSNSTKQKATINFKYIHLTLNNFTEDNFINTLVNNFKLNTTYSVFIKLSFHNNLTLKMIGAQVGFVIKDNHDISTYKERYKLIEARLEKTVNIYQLEDALDSIELLYFESEVAKELALGNIDNMKLPNYLKIIKDAKRYFNNKFIPFTVDGFYY